MTFSGIARIPDIKYQMSDVRKKHQWLLIKKAQDY